MREFWPYLQAIGKQGAMTVTGVTVTLFGVGWSIATWINPKLQGPEFKPWMLVAAGLVLLFFSTFFAWRAEHLRAEGLRRDLDRAPQPRILAKYDGNLLGDTSTQPLVVALENIGETHALMVQARSLDFDGQIVEFSRARLMRAGETTHVKTTVTNSDGSRPLEDHHNTLGCVLATKRGDLLVRQRTWPLVVDYTDSQGVKYQSDHVIQLDVDSWTAAILPSTLGVKVEQL